MHSTSSRCTKYFRHVCMHVAPLSSNTHACLRHRWLVLTPLFGLPIFSLQHSTISLIISPRSQHSQTSITAIEHQSAQMGNQNKRKGLSRFFHSASDSNLSSQPPEGLPTSDSDSQSAQSYQAALSPPTISRRRRILNRLGWESRLPSPHPSPPAAGVAPHNTGTSPHHITSSASSSGHHDSPSYPGVQGASFASVTVPVSKIVSTPVSAPVSAPVIEQTSPQPTASPANTSTPEAELSTDPDTVWTKALDIAQKKLTESNLPQLDRTNLTSESAGENIEAVVKSLNVLQQDEQRNRWRYTWRGKEVIITERLGKILRSMEKYSTVVGTAIQCDPQVSAIVWAGIQGIMRVCMSFTTLTLCYTDSLGR